MSDVSMVPADQLKRLVEDILTAHGVSVPDAHLQATIWVEADLRGQPSHGVQRLFTLLGRIANGVVNVRSRPTYTWAAPGVLLVDGDDGLGPAIATAAVEELARRAHTQGITLALVRRAHHLGMLAPYVEQLTELGCVGIASCTSEALVHAWGAFEPMVGTNPLAIAIPIDGHPPLSMDMSTGATSRGRILHHARTGEPLLPGWAVDSRGLPTADPQAALDGAISPFGGPKGYALGVALEVLIAGLTSTALGTDVTGTLDETMRVTKGDLFICIDPRGAGLSGLGPTVTSYLDALRASPPAEGSTSVLIPGDRARAARSRHLAEGIPMHADLWHRIQLAHAQGESQS
jgi:LDH2 family malate/lactate/ureidoglycolate dehydrogenase